MSQPNRNEPCPCGSGKKYKNCCGVSNVIEISPKIYNDELDNLHQGLLNFALSNYEHRFVEQAGLHDHTFLSDNETAAESYLTGITLWTVFNVAIFENNQTIFDAFYQQQKANIKRTRTRNTFMEWANTSPSVYEVLSINNEKTQRATIKDLANDEEFEIPILDEEGFSKGSIIIGSLIPFVGYHTFFFNMLGIESHNKELIVPLFKQFSQGKNRLKETFPDFFAEVLRLGERTIEWDNPLYEMVVDLYASHMQKKGFDDETISIGVMIWHDYCHKKYPNFEKLASYASALEYLVQILIVEDYDITQKQIAEEYGTTATTVSTNYRKLIDSVDEDIEADNDEDEFNFPQDDENPVDMERELRDIQKLLGDQQFSSIEEANEFLSDMINEGVDEEQLPTSPRDTAQDLIFDAQNVQGKKRKQLIQEALNVYPNSSDAYLLLAEDANSEEEFQQLIHKAVLVGEKDLGKAFFLENKGHFWMMIETRPYMRAKAMYANHMYEIGNVEEAIDQYEEMLRLNPNDNQGMRYILLTAYIELEKFDAAQALIQEFDEDKTANFLFNNVLAHYLSKGMIGKTKQLIQEANKQNPFVKDYLLGNKEIPHQDLDHIGYGDETEAIVYAQEHIHIWEEHLKLLKNL